MNQKQFDRMNARTSATRKAWFSLSRMTRFGRIVRAYAIGFVLIATAVASICVYSRCILEETITLTVIISFATSFFVAGGYYTTKCPRDFSHLTLADYEALMAKEAAERRASDDADDDRRRHAAIFDDDHNPMNPNSSASWMSGGINDSSRWD